MRPRLSHRASQPRGALAPTDEVEETGRGGSYGNAQPGAVIGSSCAAPGGSVTPGALLNVAAPPFRTTKALSLAPHHLRRSPDETVIPSRQQRAASFADDQLVSHMFRRDSSMGSPTPSLLGDLLDGDDGELYDAFEGLSFEHQMAYAFPPRPVPPFTAAHESTLPSYETVTTSPSPPRRIRKPIPVLWAPNSLRAPNSLEPH